MPENALKRHGWLLLWMGLLLTALSSRPPLPIDETRYLSVAWEMWQSHQFLVPHINGIPYSHKPPLLFWLIQAGWWLFGVNAWSARLTAPIFGLLAILLTLRLCRALWPGDRELHTGIPYLLLGISFWAFYATLTMFDMLIVCFSLVAWTGLWLGRENRKYLGWILYGAATGLGILAKGPVILVYILPPALLAPWWMGREKIHSWTGWYVGLVSAVIAGVLIALAWAIPAARAGGEQYAQAILFGQTAGRVVHSFAHQRPFYWYLLLLPALFFPWSFCLPVWSGLRQLRLSSPVRFCLSILVPGFVLLSVISGKQVHYLLPLLPPALLLLGRGFFINPLTKPFSQIVLPVFLLFFALALFIVPTLNLQGGDSAMLRFLPPWIGIVPMISAFLLYGKYSGTLQYVIKTSTVLVGMLVVLHLVLMKPGHTIYDLTVMGRKIHSAQEFGKAVAVYPARLSDQLQFSGKLVHPLIPLQSIEDAVRWSGHNQGNDLLLFLDKEQQSFFTGSGTARPYRNGWLIFRSAQGILADYNNWIKSRSPEHR
ncbi:MAG TPA: glycosyltransferase family 39 protein [Desulfobulbus sp.]|nr:glycosyltransferase family 39 protein [Desulfobulbus sp.]